MNEQLRNLLLTATGLAPLVSAMVELYKRKMDIQGLALPICGILTGIAIGGLFAMSFFPAEVIAYAWAGFIAGLAAVGVYEIGKKWKTDGETDTK
ncbi:hypothetical protein QUW13_02655 [Enterococcus hirae]|nr:hypothetical protein [Enterococcus hirae]